MGAMIPMVGSLFTAQRPIQWLFPTRLCLLAPFTNFLYSATKKNLAGINYTRESMVCAAATTDHEISLFKKAYGGGWRR